MTAPTSPVRPAALASLTVFTGATRVMGLMGLVLAAGCGPDGSARAVAEADDTGGSHHPDPARDGFVDGTEGLWSRAQPRGSSVEQRRAMAELEAIGYAGGYDEATGASGVTVHDPARTSAGLNLFTSGHAAEATLMDMTGEVVHTWHFAYDDLPRARRRADPKRTGTWRRAQLLDDGSLLAIYEGLGLVKVDARSNLQWYFDGGAHHDLEPLPDGGVLVLTRHAALVPRIHATKPILEDCISRLDADGNEVQRVSLVECLERSPFRAVLDGRASEAGDLLHTNTIELLDDRLSGRVPGFRAGNVLLSFRETSTLAVVDLAARTVVWSQAGPWRFQHQPTVLANGNLLLFDNCGNGGFSQVVELDPVSLEERWAYRGAPAQSFFSLYCGSSQRLPNRNTLITETNPGRAFEVTPAGDVVWEYVNPHRAGAEGELIAALFEMLRLPADQPLDWLE